MQIKINEIELRERLKEIKMVVMDVDGTLTDGQIIIDDNGIETKCFNVKDGMGIKLLRDAGVNIAIISARSSRAVEMRAKELSVSRLFQGVANKFESFQELLSEYQIHNKNTVYIGDDINDIEVAEAAGVSFAVNDASRTFKDKVDVILANDGGKGAIREAAELILTGLLETRNQNG
ncbi:KdsC family phosphatase [Paenibacillus sp. GCM10023248]|uniref:KdsC family phosphatase n=1 Tax=unclassified Paenibacillus TaxID=185978 RepID=UPI0023783E2D|nr:HAD-IIIA family hydrolase [Paenibacillus sp. MAHUQ-63]MDD9266621.1 HAD-IIIA family hydrolase [Paenibacillus sp. MAHUQ-63]